MHLLWKPWWILAGQIAKFQPHLMCLSSIQTTVTTSTSMTLYLYISA